MDKEQYNKLVGARIHSERQNKHLTLKELGTLVGISESTMQRYEKGKIKSIDIDMIKRFAKALNIPAENLMGWTQNFEESSKKVNREEPMDDLPPLTYKDEREIARDLEKMLADMDDKNALAATGGTVDDAEDRELLRASLLTSMQLAKRIAKKKFTPKKYRKDEKE